MRDKLSQLLKESREAMNLTQSDVADDIGAEDFTTLSHWENGRRLKYHKIFIMMCARYELSIDDLMSAINE